MLDIFHTEQFLQIRWTFESNFFMDSRIEILTFKDSLRQNLFNII